MGWGERLQPLNPHDSAVPFDASRKVASSLRLSSPRAANDGIGEPGVLLLGFVRWSTCHWMPRPFAPSADRSGAPRFCPPAPRYVWQFRQPDSANSVAPLTASGLSAKPCCFAHSGTSPTVSEPSASFAVAPFQVRTPIEMTTRMAATKATGRRRMARSGRRSKNGSPMRRMRQSVGTPTVPSTTVSGHLKMRRR